MRPWLPRRPIYGHYEQLMNELLRENHTDFKNFLRVEPEMFFELVERVGPMIQKNTIEVKAILFHLINVF